MATMNYCPQCGAAIQQDAVFCVTCGHRFEGVATPRSDSSVGGGGQAVRTLSHPSERPLFVLLLVISIISYFALIVSVIGIAYLIGGLVFLLVSNGLAIGYIRGNAVRVSETQLPEVHSIASRLAQQMQLAETPPIYVLQQGGLLNAFAMRLLLGRNFIVIYSDIVEVAYQEGEEELGFIFAHEMAHIKQGHTIWSWLLFPGRSIPFLGQAYSRSTEFTCDRFGAHFHPKGAVKGLLILAAGKRLYRRVNIDEFVTASKREVGIWVWLSEVLASHPRLPRRVSLVQSLLNLTDK